MAPLDYETQTLITFNLIAEDSATPPNKGITIVTVIVTDYNDNEPIFSQSNYEFDVREDVNSSVVIGKVTATDKDSGFEGKINYRIQPSQFSKFLKVTPIKPTIFIISTIHFFLMNLN